jgi:hypothetical protein
MVSCGVFGAYLELIMVESVVVMASKATVGMRWIDFALLQGYCLVKEVNRTIISVVYCWPSILDRERRIGSFAHSRSKRVHVDESDDQALLNEQVGVTNMRAS